MDLARESFRLGEELSAYIKDIGVVRLLVIGGRDHALGGRAGGLRDAGGADVGSAVLKYRDYQGIHQSISRGR
jgi:hypothetical protein